jgi:hypothetical protein
MIALPDMTLGFCLAFAKLLRLVSSAQTVRFSLLGFSITKPALVHPLDNKCLDLHMIYICACADLLL